MGRCTSCLSRILLNVDIKSHVTRTLCITSHPVNARHGQVGFVYNNRVSHNAPFNSCRICCPVFHVFACFTCDPFQVLTSLNIFQNSIGGYHRSFHVSNRAGRDVYLVIGLAHIYSLKSEAQLQHFVKLIRLVVEAIEVWFHKTGSMARMMTRIAA